MRVVTILFLLFLPACSLELHQQEHSPINLRETVELLASERFEGRLTGSHGERLATEFVALYLEKLGFRPVASKSYIRPFPFVAGVEQGADNSLEIRYSDGTKFSGTLNRDWTPLGLSQSGSFSDGEVVFVGYGLSVPNLGIGKEPYDSFGDLDLRGKWVALLKFYPDQIDDEVRTEEIRALSNLRFKIAAAQERGAKGVIVLSSPLDQTRSDLVPFGSFEDGIRAAIPVISLNQSASSALFGSQDLSLVHLHEELRKGQQHAPIVLPASIAKLDINVRVVKGEGRNVLGVLRSKNPNGREAILIGAHIDHLGHGHSSNSLANESETGRVHGGADDNASGVAAVLKIAEEISRAVSGSRLTLERDLIVAFWSGEEMGILGSNHFMQEVKDGLLKDPKIIAALNLDMVGRLKDKLIVQGVSSSKSWDGLLSEVPEISEVSLIKQHDNFLPTDSLAFYNNGIPTISFFTGVHPEYHTPRDTADLINYVGLESISTFVSELTSKLVSDRSLKMEFSPADPHATSTIRGGFRAYFGTIPDYSATEVDGVKLSSVTKSSPADLAGIRGGDIISSVARKKISNIYDYTFALQKLRVGEIVEVEIVRESKVHTTRVKVGSRY